ncbi:hypothetical protein BD289DRAFT_447814 [Coniella lustricola]|uniref:Uncharacterized protein n=1 Tax=Coniella lustricola TaxID=2025994 RepID=A0A2T2ZSR7_9PEZI|nr:hypothetical protein BD289DRAFT_447814 [Coniella lustricola]
MALKRSRISSARILKNACFLGRRSSRTNSEHHSSGRNIETQSVNMALSPTNFPDIAYIAAENAPGCQGRQADLVLDRNRYYHNLQGPDKTLPITILDMLTGFSFGQALGSGLLLHAKSMQQSFYCFLVFERGNLVFRGSCPNDTSATISAQNMRPVNMCIGSRLVLWDSARDWNAPNLRFEMNFGNDLQFSLTLCTDGLQKAVDIVPQLQKYVCRF